MNNDFNAVYKKYLTLIEDNLDQMLTDGSDNHNDKVLHAARYSLMAGGKRIRPVLLLATAEMLSADMEAALKMAVAIEMIHTYSLIHDDLPCMDDDDLRRGKPTCHKVFGEAVAVLAGDALLNRAFELVLSAINIDLPGSLEAGLKIAASSGLAGMIAGQSLDLEAEGKMLELDKLTELHRHKTGALIKAPLIAAACLAQSKKTVRQQLENYADAIGLAFQIQDDILDVTADQKLLGKTTGKDVRDQKSTYVNLLGLEQARVKLVEADQSARKALDCLEEAGLNIAFLKGITDFLLNRNY